LAGKWLALLKEIAPGIASIAIMFNPKTAPAEYYLPIFEAAGTSLGVSPTAIRVHTTSEIEGAIATLGCDSRGGLVIMPDTFTHAAAHLELIIALAARYRMPVIYPFRFWVSEGGLLSYGVDGSDLFRRVPTYIDRILRGAKPVCDQLSLWPEICAACLAQTTPLVPPVGLKALARRNSAASRRALFDSQGSRRAKRQFP
jgi:ABC-type uncharacterized transport system substrate-binding protein